MNRNTVFAPGEFYHIYNRGVDKRTIYEDDTDSRRFIALLYAMNATNPIRLNNIERQYKFFDDIFELDRTEQLTDIVAYCLMPNHFHLLLKEKSDGGISKFMQKLSTGYTMYFNKRRERNGALFQGKFKSEHASDDRYLKYLFSYIHLNPVKLIQSDWKEKGISDISMAIKYLDQYKYSSYLDHMNITRPKNSVVNLEASPKYFTNPEMMNAEIQDWLHYHQNNQL